MRKLSLEPQNENSFGFIYDNVVPGDYLYCYGNNTFGRSAQSPEQSFEYICRVEDLEAREESILVLDIWSANGDQDLEGHWHMDKDTLSFYDMFIKL